MKNKSLFLAQILIITIIFLSCKNNSSTNSDLLTSNLSNQKTASEIYEPDSIFLAIKQSPIPHMISKRDEYEISGPVKELELFTVYDQDRLNNIYLDNLKISESDKTNSYSFNKEGFKLVSNRIKDKIRAKNFYDKENILIERRIENGDKTFIKKFNYDSKGRLVSISDQNNGEEIEWNYERNKHLPTNIKLYRGDKLFFETIIIWNKNGIKEKTFITYNYFDKVKEISFKEIEKYDYMSNGNYSINYVKLDEFENLLQEKTEFYSKDDLLRSLYLKNKNGEAYSVTHYRYDKNGNLLEKERRADLNTTLGSSSENSLYTDIEKPLRLVNKSNYKYDSYGNLIMTEGPENDPEMMFYTTKEDFSYNPNIDNIKTREFKYKVDKYGNWTEKVEIISGNINAYYKRKISYY